jgi:tRNA(fMet)-specific endonuclease VapC
VSRYLLDTDTVSFALRGLGRVAERLRDHRPSEIAVSAVTVAELRYGAARRRSRRLNQRLDTFLEAIAVRPFDRPSADRYGKLAADLASRGEPIGMADAMIAAHALELGTVLVTHNTRHFERIAGLNLQDWF